MLRGWAALRFIVEYSSASLFALEYSETQKVQIHESLAQEAQMITSHAYCVSAAREGEVMPINDRSCNQRQREARANVNVEQQNLARARGHSKANDTQGQMQLEVPDLKHLATCNLH